MSDKKKNHKNKLDREEYGYGYDISPNDMGVIGQNTEAKKHNRSSEKETKNKSPK